MLNILPKETSILRLTIFHLIKIKDSKYYKKIEYPKYRQSFSYIFISESTKFLQKKPETLRKYFYDISLQVKELQQKVQIVMFN